MQRRSFFKTLVGILVGTPVLAKTLDAQPPVSTKRKLATEVFGVYRPKDTRSGYIARKSIYHASYVWYFKNDTPVCRMILFPDTLQHCLDHGYYSSVNRYVYASNVHPSNLTSAPVVYVKNRFESQVEWHSNHLASYTHT